MKFRIIPLLALASFIYGCNPINNAADRHKTEHHHQEHADELSLNKGTKWQVDENTRIHAAALIEKTDAFHKKTNADLTDYHLFAGDMQQEINRLVNDCKMKGEDHDALHRWLEPVLQDVSVLKETNSSGAGKQAAQTLTEKIKKFNQYFH